MKSFKRQFIEKWVSVPYRNAAEQALLEAIEKDVWPGEESFFNELYEAFCEYYLDIDDTIRCRDNFKKAAINWLQSRTAGKAEAYHKSAEEILWKMYGEKAQTEITPFQCIAAMEEYANQFKQSQLTAAKVEEPSGNWIKADNILPSKNYNYHVKKIGFDGSIYNSTSYFKNGKWYEENGYTECRDKILEYLDDQFKQSQPTAGGEQTDEEFPKKWLQSLDKRMEKLTAGGVKDEHGGKLDGNPFNKESPAHEYWRRGYIHCLNAAATWQSQPSPSNDGEG